MLLLTVSDGPSSDHVPVQARRARPNREDALLVSASAAPEFQLTPHFGGITFCRTKPHGALEVPLLNLVALFSATQGVSGDMAIQDPPGEIGGAVCFSAELLNGGGPTIVKLLRRTRSVDGAPAGSVPRGVRRGRRGRAVRSLGLELLRFERYLCDGDSLEASEKAGRPSVHCLSAARRPKRARNHRPSRLPECSTVRRSEGRTVGVDRSRDDGDDRHEGRVAPRISE